MYFSRAKLKVCSFGKAKILMDSEEESEIITMEDGTNIRRVGFSDYFVVNPGRPPRRLLSIEEGMEFANEIGQALRRERRNTNVVIFAFLCVLIFLIIVLVVFFALVYERAFAF